jgi:hypothetical protein
MIAAAIGLVALAFAGPEASPRAQQLLGRWLS